METRMQINRLFNSNREKKRIDNQDIRLFIDQFDKVFDQYFDQKEEQLRLAIEEISDEVQDKVGEWKQNKLNTSLQNVRIGQLSEIKQRYEIFINETVKTIKQKQRAQNITLGEYGTNIKMIRKLKRYGQDSLVMVDNVNELDENKEQIGQYEQDQEQYQIQVDFMDYDNSVDDKMKIINMIDELDVNHKVERIFITVGNRNKQGQQLVQMMINRYHNIYCICVSDINDQVDQEMHDTIQQLVRQSTLLTFLLGFDNGGVDNDDGIRLMKEYNQLMQHQWYLERLWYSHNRINKEARSQQEIDRLIDEVDRM